MTPKETAQLINYLYPVARAYIYPNGYVRLGRARSKQTRKPAPRGEINGAKARSLHNLAFLVCTTTVQFASMMTLTYGDCYPMSGHTCKKHLNLMLTKTRYHFDDLSYVWWFEFQERGAPHIHLITTIKITTTSRRKLAKLWVDAIGKYANDKVFRVHNHKEQIDNLRSENGAKKYCVWYATKRKQKTIPDNFKNVGRWWGNSRDVREKIPEPVEAPVTDKLIRETYPRLANMAVLPKYIYG